MNSIFKQPKVLIITLYSGENELTLQQDRLQSQSYKNWDQKIIANLPEQQAHDELRKLISENINNHDIFIKLDADMVFNKHNSLEKIVSFFQEENHLDHLVLPVFDWPSESNIHGVHAYRSGVNFPYRGDALFTDPNPAISGIRKIAPLSETSDVDHMPDPSNHQSYMLGVHRALKIVQRDRIGKDFKNAELQLRFLSKIFDRYILNTNEPRRIYTILGAEDVFLNRYSKKVFDKAACAPPDLFDRAQRLSTTQGIKDTARAWSPGGWLFTNRLVRYVKIPSIWTPTWNSAHKLAYSLIAFVRRKFAN